MKSHERTGNSSGVARVMQLYGRREPDDPVGGPRKDAIGERVAEDLRRDDLRVALLGPAGRVNLEAFV
eukprot:1286732-Lingulodinium_polyedra.AAC.1